MVAEPCPSIDNNNNNNSNVEQTNQQYIAASTVSKVPSNSTDLPSSPPSSAFTDTSQGSTVVVPWQLARLNLDIEDDNEDYRDTINNNIISTNDTATSLPSKIEDIVPSSTDNLTNPVTTAVLSTNTITTTTNIPPITTTTNEDNTVIVSTYINNDDNNYTVSRTESNTEADTSHINHIDTSPFLLFPIMKDNFEILDAIHDDDDDTDEMVSADAVYTYTYRTTEDPLLVIQNEMADIVNHQPILPASITDERTTPNNISVVKIEPTPIVINPATDLVPLFQYSIFPPFVPKRTSSPIRLLPSSAPSPARPVNSAMFASNLPARLLEPTKSWSNNLQKRQEEEQNRRIQRASAAGSDAFSPLRTLINTTKAIDATRLRSSSISNRSGSSTNDQRSASVPPKNSRYSRIQPRVYDNLKKSSTQQQSMIPPPLLPESRYIPGNGHTRDWVTVTDKSIVMRLPETYNRLSEDLNTQRPSSQATMASQISQKSTESDTVIPDESTKSIGSVPRTRTRSLSVSSAATRTSVRESVAIGRNTAAVPRGRTSVRSSVLFPSMQSPPERHPLRKSSKQRNEEDEQEKLRAQALGLIIGARPHLSSTVYDPASQTVTYESAAARMDRAGERLYKKALENRSRKQSVAQQPPINCTFTPNLTPLAHSLGNNVPYVPKEVIEIMQMHTDREQEGDGNVSLEKNSATVPRYELLHASAAIQSAKKTAAALFAMDHDADLSFRPEITVKAQQMTTNQRIKRLAQSLPPKTKQDITITNDLGSRLFAYSQVFAERREALSRSLFAEQNPAQPKLNPRSLALAQRPHSAAAFSRRPIHEISPYTTPQALALRQEQIELAKCTFKPELSKSTNSVRRIRTTRSVSPSLHGNSTYVNNSYRTSNNEPVYERLLRLGQDTAIKLEVQRAISEAKELNGSTFTPVIHSSVSPQRSNKHHHHRTGETDTEKSNRTVTNDVSIRLYEEAKEISKRLEAKRSELQRLKQITFNFTPQISELSKTLAENHADRQERRKLIENESVPNEDIVLTTPSRKPLPIIETTGTKSTVSTDDNSVEVIYVSDHLWYDIAWDTVREFEHTIARTIQSIIKRELRNTVNRYHPSSRQINALTKELILCIRSYQPSPPRSILIFSGDSKTENKGIITVQSNKALSSVPMNGSTKGGNSSNISYLLALSSTDAQELTTLVWKTLVDYLQSHDEEKQQLNGTIRQRCELKDTTFAPRNLERYTPIIKRILQDRIQQVWDRLLTGSSNNTGNNSVIEKLKFSSNTTLKLTSVNPQYTYRSVHNNINENSKKKEGTSTVGNGLKVNHNIWNELAHEQKDVPLLKEISRRIELAPCTFRPNTESMVKRVSRPVSQKVVPSKKNDTNNEKISSTESVITFPNSNRTQPLSETSVKENSLISNDSTLTPSRSTSSKSSTRSSIASSISSFIASIPPTPKGSQSLYTGSQASTPPPSSQEGEDNLNNDNVNNVILERKQSLSLPAEESERDQPSNDRKNSTASTITNRSTTSSITNHRGPGFLNN